MTIIKCQTLMLVDSSKTQKSKNLEHETFFKQMKSLIVN